MSPAAKMDRKRHCWECLRRSLVCDFTEPECKRCSAAGNLCPGYGEKKPVMLNWLEPGRVKSRTRRAPKKKVAEGQVIKPPKSNNLELGLEPGVPWSCLRVNSDAVMDAIGYYNEAMYPILKRGQAGNHPGVYQIQPAHIRVGIARPEFLTLDIVCVALNHRIHSSTDKAYAQSLVPTYYHYRGQVLRSLNERISDQQYQKGNLPVLIAGILSLLLADAHQGASNSWRFHLEGIKQLINIRGGFRAMSEPGIEPILLCYAFVTVLGDTTSPASDLTMTPSLLSELNTILEDHGDKPYSFYPFPTPLFAAIVKVNHLRARAAARITIGKDTADLTTEAESILTTIQSFGTEAWAETHDNCPLVLMQIIQSAVTIYAISSLKSLSILPDSPMLNIIHSTTRSLLYTLLKEGLAIPGLSRCLHWSLVVLGVDAASASSGSEMRTFVRESLGPISRDHGSYVPLLATDLLEKFWASGKKTWDECFESPVALAMQWTVNRGGLRS